LYNIAQNYGAIVI